MSTDNVFTIRPGARDTINYECMTFQMP